MPFLNFVWVWGDYMCLAPIILNIPPNEEIIRHNICNVELQPNICDV